ncbi:hypothetical protein JCM8795_17170 [Hydrogenobaculum acidophilum]
MKNAKQLFYRPIDERCEYFLLKVQSLTIYNILKVVKLCYNNFNV